MMSYGKCPKCGVTIVELRLGHTTAKTGPAAPGGLGAIILCCPNINCGVVLGAQINPIDIQNDIVKETAEAVEQKVRYLMR